MHLSLEVLLTVGADEEVSLTETDSTPSRLYTGNRMLRFIIYLLFSTVIILFILILFHISVHLSKVQVC